MKWCYFCFVLLLVGSCTLSSSQEAALHKAVTSYIDAHNTGAVKLYVGFTHPNVVGFYQGLGDEKFREKFELFSPEDVEINSLRLENQNLPTTPKAFI